MSRLKDDVLIRKESSKQLTNLLILWFFITILPQMMLLTREDSGNFTIKIALLGIFLILIFYYALRNPIKFNITSVLGWIWFMLIQLTSNIVLKPSVVENNNTIYINIILSSLYILIFLVMFDRLILSSQDIRRFCKFYLIIVMYACLYNIINNYDVLGRILSVTSTYQYSLSSFFSNRNTFAIFLSFGIIACFILHDSEESYGKYEFLINVCLIVIGLNLLLTNARTSIFSTMIYILLRYYLVNKKRFVSFMVKLFVIVASLILIVWVTGMGSYIINIVIRPNSGFTNRDIIWRTGIDVFINNNIIFGTGEVYPKLLVEAITGNTGFHSTYISLLVFGGVSLLGFHFLLIKKTLSRCRSIMKYDTKIGINLMSAIFMYLVSSMAETNILFYSSALNVVATIFIVLLPKYYYNYLNAEEKIC